MAPRRKLFLTHAGELAHRLVRSIARNSMSMEFVRGYAHRHGRRKVTADPERLREMESTISREALLLISAEVRRLLPQAFGFSRAASDEGRMLCDLFYTEFLNSLGRALEWPSFEAESEALAFRRDLEIYARWRERNPKPLRGGRSSKDDAPFPDRCAILLDPAMMEQARRAAAAFQTDLLRFGVSIFGQLGRIPERPEPSRARGRATNTRAPKSPARTGNKGARAAGKLTAKATPRRRPR